MGHASGVPMALLKRRVAQEGARTDSASCPPPLRTLANESGVEWRRGLTLPEYALETAAAPPFVLNRHMPRDDEERAPILPSLFMPGFPKSATSWLYSCLMALWSPEHVGCGAEPNAWGSDACKKRYLLPVTSSTTSGQMRLRKEMFFYGGAVFFY